jgi:hypothetical protein
VARGGAGQWADDSGSHFTAEPKVSDTWTWTWNRQCVSLAAGRDATLRGARGRAGNQEGLRGRFAVIVTSGKDCAEERGHGRGLERPRRSESRRRQGQSGPENWIGAKRPRRAVRKTAGGWWRGGGEAAAVRPLLDGVTVIVRYTARLPSPPRFVPVSPPPPPRRRPLHRPPAPATPPSRHSLPAASFAYPTACSRSAPLRSAREEPFFRAAVLHLGNGLGRVAASSRRPDG